MHFDLPIVTGSFLDGLKVDSFCNKLIINFQKVKHVDPFCVAVRFFRRTRATPLIYYILYGTSTFRYLSCFPVSSSTGCLDEVDELAKLN